MSAAAEPHQLQGESAMGFWVMVLSFILGALFVVMGLRRSSESRLKPLWLGLGVLFFVAAVWLAWPK